MRLIKNLGVAFLLIVPLLAGAQIKTFKLIGKLGKPSSKARVYLGYNGLMERTDSATAINGQFVFTGQLKEPVMAYLIIKKLKAGIAEEYGHYIDLYLEPGTISVTSQDSLENAIVTGSNVNADYNELKTSLKPVDEQQRALDKILEALTPEQQHSKEIIRPLHRSEDSLDNEAQLIAFNFIKDHPNSIASLGALARFSGDIPDYAKVQPLFNSLSQTIQSSRAGKEYSANFKNWQKTSVGTMAPDFNLADTSGKMISLHDFKGKYVLVDFWASWCTPCREKNPNVVKAYNDYKDKNFTVLSISLDDKDGKEKWIKAIHDDGLTWTQVSDLKGMESEVAQSYVVDAIPQNFLINPDGKIVGKNLRGNDLENKLAEVLN